MTEATTNITAITKANPAAVTTASHGLSNGDRVLIFSQFTMMMDIMEKYLKIRGHR